MPSSFTSTETDAPTPGRPRVPTSPGWRHFVRHAAEMALSMVVGMALLGPIWDAVLTGADPSAPPGPELATLIAAVNMSAGMIVWMLYRGHHPARVLEMAAATSVPYLLLIVPLRLGMGTGEQIIMTGHVLMLLAMVATMLARRREYSGAPGGHTAHPVIEALGQRWPSWIALSMCTDNWQQPSVPTPWVLLLLPAGYLLLGGIRGQLRDRRQLARQLAGLAGYVVLVVIAVNSQPVVAAWLVAAGWGVHALWDLAHHRAGAVVPRGYAEWCAVIDAVIALTVVLLLVTAQ